MCLYTIPIYTTCCHRGPPSDRLRLTVCTQRCPPNSPTTVTPTAGYCPSCTYSLSRGALITAYYPPRAGELFTSPKHGYNVQRARDMALSESRLLPKGASKRRAEEIWVGGERKRLFSAKKKKLRRNAAEDPFVDQESDESTSSTNAIFTGGVVVESPKRARVVESPQKETGPPMTPGNGPMTPVTGSEMSNPTTPAKTIGPPVTPVKRSRAPVTSVKRSGALLTPIKAMGPPPTFLTPVKPTDPSTTLLTPVKPMGPPTTFLTPIKPTDLSTTFLTPIKPMSLPTTPLKRPCSLNKENFGIHTPSPDYKRRFTPRIESLRDKRRTARVQGVQAAYT